MPAVVKAMEKGITETIQHNQRALIRHLKGQLYRPVRLIKQARSTRQDYLESPPVFVNSFPKSGTNLLFQILSGLPGIRDHHSILISNGLKDLVQLSQEKQGKLLGTILPGEIAHGHFVYSNENTKPISNKNMLHFFIYRDLRDVVISEFVYITYMNFWHPLHRYFSKTLKTDHERIKTVITGLSDSELKVDYKNIRERFEVFRGWLEAEDVFVLRFESLVSPDREITLTKMANYCAHFSPQWEDTGALVEKFLRNMSPNRSHTYRKGKVGSWRELFQPEHIELMDEIAGPLNRELGYS